MQLTSAGVNLVAAEPAGSLMPLTTCVQALTPMARMPHALAVMHAAAPDS